ncbi:MAG: antibiotic biosynthesis monooxygenase [Pseudomonadota bacterium]|nr:antibiotic biosynthesis monooxygenase [Pseudomonadota bacterium]
MIHVIATIELVPGRRQAFLEEFHRLVPEVHKENGCIEYGPTVDLATDIPGMEPVRDNVVTIVEKWDSVEALKAHLAAPHMQQYRTRVKDLVARTRVAILEPA